ncbi:hypothetical protein ABE41_018245 [Fictibacillus arsenicus]|uniref:Uncharacterized protein n=1 Tax=Fictibacillus arsenicus TaxID=255247 RepID=A0A1B1Z943_9BACL|nr:hypothetical protein ABE41_018245 [Fictibacillus arsenicus]
MKQQSILFFNRIKYKLIQKNTRTVPTIIVSIILTIFMFISESVMNGYLVWDEEYIYLSNLLFMTMIGMQILLLFMQKIRFKYSVLISLILAFSMFVLYKEGMEWLGLQVRAGHQKESLLIYTYLMFYGVLTLWNIHLNKYKR